MSYVQIEIGGKLRGLKFNQMADVEYLVKVGKNTNPVASTYAMVWAGLISNCYAKAEEVDFTFEQVCDWCEKVTDADFIKILDAYKETKAFLKDIPEDVKKKQTVEDFDAKKYQAKCLEIAFGKLGWSPFEYYTSSPQEFYYACKGYFDKEDVLITVIRKHAQIVWGGNGGKGHDFERFWPMGGKVPDKVVWGTKEEADELRKRIEKAHGIKLS